jgi:hypothetical protein
MAVSRPIACSQLSFTNTADAEALVGGAQRVLLRTSADCYVDFDQPTATSQSAIIKAADNVYLEIEAIGANIQKIHARGSAGSGTLYIRSIIN